MIVALYLFQFILGANICYSPLGCFTNEPPYSIEGYRPKILPWGIEDNNPQFYLSTQTVKDEFIIWENVNNTEFENETNKNHAVVVTVHGWTNYYDPD